MESLKDRWFQADNPPADQLLNEEEFLSFLHPEHSRGMLKYMVKEIVRDLGMKLMRFRQTEETIEFGQSHISLILCVICAYKYTVYVHTYSCMQLILTMEKCTYSKSSLPWKENCAHITKT